MVEERPPAGVVLVMLTQSVLNVGEPSTDAVLVSFERWQVDGVGEMRGEQLVALGFQARPIRGEVSEFLILARAALVECGVDLECSRKNGDVVYAASSWMCLNPSSYSCGVK